MQLLEREAHLERLAGLLAEVRASGEGRLVVVGGEAGVGKTVLTRAFAAAHPDSAPVIGACDPLFTPRPLGPLVDVADQLGVELGSGPAPADVLTALGGRLGRGRVVVLEDLHWADAATLDVLRLLGRRVRTIPALVVGTCRDDELDRAHPLRVLLGELPRDDVVRVHLEPLSVQAVAELALDGVDASALHALTGGNPFFVTEVLAGGDVTSTPATVRDAVLARVARLESAARPLLEAVSIFPGRADLALVEALVGDGLSHLEACEGMVVAGEHSVAFRHEIARAAVEQAMPAARRRALHRAALAALAGGDPARLAHHAGRAGDAAAVLEHAPAAGAAASRVGAHREAAAHYDLALRHAGALTPAERADLLSRHGFECYMTGRVADAVASYEAARDLHRQAGDARREGEAERWVSRCSWFTGENTRATAAAQRAIALLEPLGPGRELAMAWSNLSQLCMLEGDVDATRRWGGRAIALAEELGEREILIHALNNVGAAERGAGIAAGREKLTRSLELALAEGLEEHVARAYTNLCTSPSTEFRASAQALEEGLAYCAERDLHSWLAYMQGWKARLDLDQGRWEDAAALATRLVERRELPPPTRITPLLVIGLLRARRGDPGAWTVLDEALELAGATGELQRIGPVAVARAEARWLAGEHDRVDGETAAALALAVRRTSPWYEGELCVWRRRSGLDADGAGAGTPFREELAGDHAAAAAWWRGHGCDYNAALALAMSDDEAALADARGAVVALGAKVAADALARRLRELGVRGVTRGPRAATRANPAGLTARQLEVLVLLAEGAPNADIAARLHLSEKTVGHHVSAILQKLGVANRSQAGAAAVRLGVTGSASTPVAGPAGGRTITP